MINGAEQTVNPDTPRLDLEDVRGAGVVLRILSGNDVPDNALAGLVSPWLVLAKYLRKRPIDQRESALRQWLNGREPPEAARLKAALAEAKRQGLGDPDAGEDEDPFPINQWPEPPGEEAFHGVLGDLVRKILPHTQADAVALLGQALVMFGNVIGRTAHFVAEADRHYGNEFLGLVGTTSKGAKGSSYGHVKRLFESVDPDWSNGRVLGGLSSGEGLIWAVRDPIERDEPVKEKGRVIDYQKVTIDFGIGDKRLLVHEGELVNVLRQKKRENNVLDAVLRLAWDGQDLRTMTKNSPAVATSPHISIIGHITKDELLNTFANVDASNGFANRFIWLCSRRSKSLPFGGSVWKVDFAPEVRRLQAAVDFARQCNRIVRSDETNHIWADVYGSLDEPRPGLLGSILARAAPHVMRLAVTYAMLDQSAEIFPEHLNAALALWAYSERSARFIFGGSLGDPDAERLLAAIRQAPEGLTRTQIARDVFAGHKEAGELGRLLGRLLEHNLIVLDKIATKGRPKEVFRATTAKKAN